MKIKKFLSLITIIFIILLSISLILNLYFLPKERILVTVYASPNCECCKQYVSYLKNNGFEVNLVLLEDLNSVKNNLKIPENMRSCHTSIINNYFIEGHVPVEAIQKLLKEKPNIFGISLPGMPAGSPGMGGIKEKEFIIYSISNEGIKIFMII